MNVPTARPAESPSPVRPAPAATDTPKPKKERRPRRQWRRGQGAAAAGYLWLVLVGLCVGAMSWTGLVGFARDTLHLTEPLCFGVPISLDGSAVTLAFFALRAVLSGGAAGLPRLLAVVVVVASSAFNVYHAEQSGQGTAAAVFFGGMSVLVYVMFEVVLRHLRREHLSELGAIEPPLARFRLARWLPGVAFLETFRAWKAAVRYGITDPTEALERAREPRARRRWRRTVATEPAAQPKKKPPEPEEAPREEPEPVKRPAGEAREMVRQLLGAHGDDLTRAKVRAATGVGETRAGQLLREERAALNGNGAKYP